MRLRGRLTWRTAALATVIVGAVLAAVLAVVLTRPAVDPPGLSARGSERSAAAALRTQFAGSVDDFTFDSFAADYWLGRGADRSSLLDLRPHR